LQRYQLRQTEAVPLLKGLKKWLGESVRHVPPKSSLGKAIDYALKQWPYLEAYANHGEIEIDNNLIENQIRPFALGRKNWLFMGNERGVQVTATLYSLIKTCEINKINTPDYFNSILNKLPAVRRREIDANSLLPQFIDIDTLSNVGFLAAYHQAKFLVIFLLSFCTIVSVFTEIISPFFLRRKHTRST
jgi:hypothetical protein